MYHFWDSKLKQKRIRKKSKQMERNSGFLSFFSEWFFRSFLLSFCFNSSLYVSPFSFLSFVHSRTGALSIDEGNVGIQLGLLILKDKTQNKVVTANELKALTKGIATRNKGITTSSKKLLGAPGLATRNKGAAASFCPLSRRSSIQKRKTKQ